MSHILASVGECDLILIDFTAVKTSYPLTIIT